MKHAVIFLAVLAGSAGSLQAAPKPAAAQQDITVSSDKFQADLNAKTGTYSGNVVIVRGDMKLRADTVKLTTVNGKADKVMASGKVVVDSPKSGTATGDNGVYSIVPNTVVMTGNVVLKKGKDVMRGTQLTVNLATGQAVLGGGVKSQTGTQGNGRVQAIFTPNSN